MVVRACCKPFCPCAERLPDESAFLCGDRGNEFGQLIYRTCPSGADEIREHIWSTFLSLRVPVDTGTLARTLLAVVLILTLGWAS